jgi:hypothetical protein
LLKLREVDEQIKRLLAIQKAMNGEMENMQERMDNVYALEETVRRQEVVIEQMESQIRKLWNNRNGKSYFFRFKSRKRIAF